MHALLAPPDAARLLAEVILRRLGSAESGNYGHAGRPGQVGGSAPSSTTFYHGTAEARLQSIRKTGLKASHAGQVWTGTKSGHVFVTPDFEQAKEWAERAAEQLTGGGVIATPAVVRVEVPEEKVKDFAPDLYVDQTGSAFEYGGDIPSEWITDAWTRKGPRKWIDPEPWLKAAGQNRTFYVALVLLDTPKTLGGPGSGYFGHAGRPGEVGGSSPSGGATAGGATAGGATSEFSTEDLDAKEAKIIAEAVTPEERQYARRLAEAELKLEAELRDGDSKDENTVRGVYTPERLAIHDQIIQQYFIDKAKQGEMIPRDLPNPHVIMMAGAPGAGKTTARSELDLTGYVIADSDQMKEYLRPYGYNGDNAIEYQRETSDLSAKLVEFARQNHMNVMVDRANRSTGSLKDPAGTFDGALGQLAAFREAGYTTEYRFVSVPLEVSIARAVNRYIETGRYVPMSFIRDTMFDKNKSSIPEQSFRRSIDTSLGGRPLVDSAWIFDGVTRKGTKLR